MVSFDPDFRFFFIITIILIFLLNTAIIFKDAKKRCSQFNTFTKKERGVKVISIFWDLYIKSFFLVKQVKLRHSFFEHLHFHPCSKSRHIQYKLRQCLHNSVFKKGDDLMIIFGMACLSVEDRMVHLVLKEDELCIWARKVVKAFFISNLRLLPFRV